ncbi:MAG: 30S ribosomal protein S17 [Gammaproteobacteria bacterium]|nr:30S ribosomal protein S17 [Gammaproteobacteria bacterium]
MSGKVGNGRLIQGVVVSDKMHKGIVVKVEYRKRHPSIGKLVRSSAKFHAHDENNECKVGDTVTIQECPPISKTKTWRLVCIDERAK